MADALAPYRQKRNFGITPEPRGATAKRGEALSFVIQKHAARSLHYDFRLELDGTLKSWAVPKGPSLDPSQKRMAVHVEDHPLAYGSFEGTIPANQYGAGDVIVWDRGTWHPEGDPSAGYRAGKLKFRLDGEKLKGTWMLIRMHGRESDRQEPWLLIKERDATARPAAEYSVVDALPNSVLSQRAVVEAPKGKARSASESNPSAAQAGSKSATATATATATAKGAKAAAGSKGEAAKAKSTTTRAASKTAAKPARKGSRDASSTATTDDTARPAPTKAGAARTKAKPPPTAPSLPAGAVRSALPATLEPELATLVKEVPANGDWSYEIKFDGYRVLARIENGEVRLLTRNGNDWTAKLRGIADAIGRLGLDATWLDGEIVVLGAHGASDFAALQNAFDGGGATIRYFVFDLPFHAGHDLRRVPLGERRALLGALLADADGVVRFSQDFESDPDEILRNACRLHLEGVIGKRIDSAYVGGRTRDWIKLKCTLRQEFVIAGYTEPQGSRTGLGALLLGIHDERGRLRYAGNVGTGFDVKTLGALRKELSKLETAQAPFADKARTGRATWVEPKLVAEISFSEWTRDGKVRHAVFHGLRSDKPPQAITREVAAPTPRGKLPEQPATPNDAAPAEPAPASKPARPASARARPAATAASKAQADPPPTPALPASVRVTHPDRVIDPKSGHTKRDLVDYYLHAARRIQPHLQGRPVALVRAPAGVEGHHFFQKHSGSLHIDDLVELPEALDPGHPPLIEIDSFTALISAAQMNVVEFHTWNAMSRAIEKPDRMTFDLDPGEGVGWAAMVEAARLTRSLLDAIGLVAFVKTSGGKGLHVVVPLAPREGWDDVKDFSREVVERLAELAPDKLVAKSGPKNRVGRIFVDYLRNGRGATTAAAYSARARAGLGVSVPCDWDELDALRGGDHWTIANAHERLEAAADPWADYASCRQALGAARKALRRGVAA